MRAPQARIALVFLATRALLVAATLVPWPLARSLEPPLDTRVPWSTGGAWLPGDPPRWLDSFARMDADYYLTIAVFGYSREPDGRLPQHAGFFPGYPVAIRGVARAVVALSGRPGAPLHEAPVVVLVSAFAVSNLALLLAALALFRLGRLFLDERAAETAAVWLLVCPLAFFGSTYLAEALFLWLSVESVLAAFQGRPGRAAVFAAAAAFTRPIGVFLAIPLLMISWRARAEAGRHLVRDAAWVLLVPAGAAAVLLWHARALGDAWAYLEIQRGYGHGGFPDFAGVADLFRIGGKDTLALIRDGVQLATLAAAAACIGALLVRRGRQLPAAIAAWALVAISVPLLSGHLISVPRYAFAVFPLFLGAALLASSGRGVRAAQAASVALQLAGFVVFTRAWPVLI
jgi:Mannosyltransferase (PIG-V)